MSTAAEKIARLDRSIARTGESIVLQRVMVDAAAVVTLTEEITCPAHVRASQPQDLLEPGIREHRVILSATSLAQTSGSPAGAFGIPRRDDRVVIQGEASNVQESQPIYYDGELVRVNILARGGGG